MTDGATTRGTIGFIGLGNMGRPMAANLLTAGRRLLVHSRTRPKAARLVEAGTVWCDEPGAVLGLAEGLGLAAAGGLDVARLAPTLGEGTAGGFRFKAYAEKMIAGDFAATFTVAHLTKDLRLALAEAASLGVDTVALRAALGQFERLARERGDALGIQAIAALYK